MDRKGFLHLRSGSGQASTQHRSAIPLDGNDRGTWDGPAENDKGRSNGVEVQRQDGPASLLPVNPFRPDTPGGRVPDLRHAATDPEGCSQVHALRALVRNKVGVRLPYAPMDEQDLRLRSAVVFEVRRKLHPLENLLKGEP